MKKSLLYFSLIVIICCTVLKPDFTYAQNEKGQSVVTLGAGGSLVGVLFKAVENSVNSTGGNVSLSSIPAILGMYDFALAKRLSVGLAFSYQSFSSNYSSYTYANSQGINVTGSFKDRISRINYAIRPLIHLGNNEDLDMYIGPRIGYTKWAFTTNNTDPYYSSSSNYSSLNSNLKFQVLYGIRYFFNEQMGVNGEIAIGAPYYMMGGLNYRF